FLLICQVSVELNPGLTPPLVLPPGVVTLHFLLCNHGALALLMVNTYSTQSAVQLDWPSFINRSSSGSLKVEPQTSVRYSRALVFTRVWEYDDVSNTADPQQTPESSFYPPYELQNFIWSDPKITVNQTGHTVTLCGREKTESFLNGSLCLQVSRTTVTNSRFCVDLCLISLLSSVLRNRSRFALEFQSVGDSVFRERAYDCSCIDDEYKPFFFQVNTSANLHNVSDFLFVCSSHNQHWISMHYMFELFKSHLTKTYYWRQGWADRRCHRPSPMADRHLNVEPAS
uniref:Glycosylated lysosomal membrane protein n=1 Tax=Sinocyclocheilus anshuiensis TaxID=1608454 RepID=A0A671KRX6_9TELE